VTRQLEGGEGSAVGGDSCKRWSQKGGHSRCCRPLGLNSCQSGGSD
jgi:hypothetical protein